MNLHQELNKKVGLKADEETYDTSKVRGRPVVYSSDPVQSDVVPRKILLHSIDELRALMTNSQTADDSGIDYPEPLPKTADSIIRGATSRQELLSGLHGRLKSNILKAANAYISGDPEKVGDYRDLINALMFPATVAYFSSTTKVIDSEITITGPDPVVWNYDSIEFKPGGSIIAHVAFSITCNTMSKSSS